MLSAATLQRTPSRTGTSARAEELCLPRRLPLDSDSTFSLGTFPRMYVQSRSNNSQELSDIYDGNPRSRRAGRTCGQDQKVVSLAFAGRELSRLGADQTSQC